MEIGKWLMENGNWYGKRKMEIGKSISVFYFLIS